MKADLKLLEDARIVATHAATIWRAIKRGALPATRRFGRLRIRESELQSLPAAELAPPHHHRHRIKSKRPRTFAFPTRRRSRMAEEIRLWRIEPAGALCEVSRSRLDLEIRLEGWLAKDISILDPGLLIIGRQVPTDFGGVIDLLCLNRSGDLVVVELKRDRTPREITAQTLDYGSWVKELPTDRIMSIAEGYLHEKLDEAFGRRFSAELPEALNEDHRLLIVASEVDPSSERIIRYLSDTFGVNINAATFQYFREEDGRELVARVFLIEPTQVELQSRTKGASKRRPNLTYQELESLADENGVGDIYRYAVSGFERYLQKHTTRSSIGFSGAFEDSRKNVLSLIPQQSTADDGLRFQVYFLRLRSLLGVPEDAALSLLPTRKQPWTFYEAGGPDYSGFQGYFTDRTEVDRLVNALAESRPLSNQGR